MSIGAPPLSYPQWSSPEYRQHKRFSSPSTSGTSLVHAPPMSPGPSVVRPFRFSAQTDGLFTPKSGRVSDSWMSAASRARTPSTTPSSASRKGKEKETIGTPDSISIHTDPFPNEARMSSSSHRPATADPSLPRKNRGSLLVAASDALGFGRRRKSVKQPLPAQALLLSEVIEIRAPKRDEEEQERQRLRDAAAQSIGFGLDILEPARTREDSVYEDEGADSGEKGEAPHEELRTSETFSVSSNHHLSSPVPLAMHAMGHRRRGGSLSLSLQQSRATHSTPTPTVPTFPASYSSLTPWVHLSGTLPKHYPPPSLLMMALSKQWKNRFVVLTSPTGAVRQTRSEGPSVSYLHVFKSGGAEEREMERLEINEKSVVFVTDEEVGGRRSVIKVGGVDVGVLRRELNSEENGQTMLLLQIVDGAESRRWINAIKNAVLGQRSIRAGLGLPSLNMAGPEPRGDMDVMLSMRMQGILSSPAPSSFQTSDYGASSSNGTDSSYDQPVTPLQPGTVRSLPSSPRSSTVSALKGLFTGSRPRSPSRAASPEPGYESPGDSFGSVGSNLLGMLKSSGSVPGERVMSPTAPPPILKPRTMLPSPMSTLASPESHLSRKIVQNRTSLDWAPAPGDPPAAKREQPARALSPSLPLQPPPPRKRAWTTTEPVPAKQQSPGPLVYTHANSSTAGSFGIAFGTEATTPTATSRGSFDYAGSAHSGTPVQKSRAPSVSSVSTIGSGDRGEAALDRSHSSHRRWSRHIVLPKRMTPPSGSPPPVPMAQSWQSTLSFNHRISHPYAADRSGERPPSRESSSAHSHRNMSAGLPLFSKRASGSSSVYSVASNHSVPSRTSTSSHPPPRQANMHRLSVPPPQRPAPSSALPPTPPNTAVPNASAKRAASLKRPDSAPVPKSAFRDSLAHRAMRLSMLPPTSPPSHVLPPRPDEPTIRRHHRRSTSADSNPFPDAAHTSTEPPYPAPTGPLPPPPAPSSPRLTSSIKQRLRIRSAPSPPPLTPSADAHFVPVSNAYSPPATPIAERITTMQNDPNFLLLATPVTPTSAAPPPLPPQLPPRSPFRPPPPERSPPGPEMTSLSPPPRRGSRQIPNGDKEQAKSEVPLLFANDVARELGDADELEKRASLGLSRTASTLSLDIVSNVPRVQRQPPSPTPSKTSSSSSSSLS